MNIDERLEALTHSVELLAAMHKDNEEKSEKRMDATDKQIKRLGKLRAHHRRTGARSRCAVACP